MSRTKNAKNKPKFANISLGQLCAKLKDSTPIPVEIKFLQALSGTGISFEEIQNTPTAPVEELQYVVTDHAETTS